MRAAALAIFSKLTGRLRRLASDEELSEKIATAHTTTSSDAVAASRRRFIRVRGCPTWRCQRRSLRFVDSFSKGCTSVLAVQGHRGPGTLWATENSVNC